MSKRKHPKDRGERRVLQEKKKRYMKFDEFIRRVQENHEPPFDGPYKEIEHEV